MCCHFVFPLVLAILHGLFSPAELTFHYHLQWMLQIPGATSYMGSIGKDKFGEEMKKNALDAGVNVNSLSLFSLSAFFSSPFSPGGDVGLV